MASFLYRLGRVSARRPYAVIGAWLAALLLALAGYVVAGGTLASSFSIPGTPTARVTSQLENQFPALAGLNATVVFHSENGEPFTATQRAEIAETLDAIGEHESVERVVGPFAAQNMRAKEQRALTRGEVRLTEAKAQLKQAQAQLDEAESAAAESQQALADEMAQARANGS